MLKQYLKHNSLFRSVFSIPLAIRSKFLNSSLTTHGKRDRLYQKVVAGGQLVLSPANIGGRFRISAVSHLAKRVLTTGEFEPELTKVLLRLTSLNGDVINIGANVGFYSVFFAQKFPGVRKVYAIEPNPEAFSNLVWNIAQNNCVDRVEPIQICIGDTNGDIDFSIIPDMPEYSSIGGVIHPAAKDYKQQSIKVRISSLKDAISSTEVNPQLIFVDTEGAELLVFRGAENILKEKCPLLIFECEDRLLRKFGHTSAMLEDYLSSIGYTVRNAFDPRLSLQHPFQGEAVAFPSAKMEWVKRLQGK
jgi:FkbM family methyltransferase